jgi:hypothetical protein
MGYHLAAVREGVATRQQPVMTMRQVKRFLWWISAAVAPWRS